MTARVDLLVVGGGTAGLVGARTAAGFGASVLLVERDRTGGECLWTGCVPSKALLAAAHAAATVRAAGRVGVTAGDPVVDFPAVMASVHAAMAAIAPVDSPAALRADGVQVDHATARFTGPDTADVGGRTVRFRAALLCTGSTPLVPPLPGLADAGPLTTDTVWDLTEQPRRLLVLGGGTIGAELGQGFARLGTDVTVVEAAERLLAREDADAAALVHAALTADGVTVRTGVAVDAVRPGGGGAGTAVLADGSEVAFDRVLVAVGRRARTTGLGLDAAGIDLDERGYVRVDDTLRTSNPRVRAAGDVTGHPQFTHVAGVHGSLAASNAVLGLRRTVELDAVPRVTYTQPELAAVGRAPGPGDRVRTVDHGEVDRAVVEGETAGFTRLVVDRRGRVVGATIVGPRAGESLAEVVLAVTRRLRTRDIAAAIHAYPTFDDGVWKAAIADVQAGLRRPVPRLVVGALRRSRALRR